MKNFLIVLCALLLIGGIGCNKKNPSSPSDDVRTMSLMASNSGILGIDFTVAGGASVQPANSDMNIDGGEWFYVTNGTRGYYTGSSSWSDVMQAPAAGSFSSDTTTAVQPAGTPIDSTFVNKIWVWITQEGNYVKFQITGIEGGIRANPPTDPKYTFKYFIAPLGTTQFK